MDKYIANFEILKDQLNKKEIKAIDCNELRISYICKYLPSLKFTQHNEVKSINYEKLNQYVKLGYFNFIDINDKKYIAVNNLDSNFISEIEQEYYDHHVVLINVEEFRNFLQEYFANDNTNFAINYEYNRLNLSAKHLNYKNFVTMFIFFMSFMLSFYASLFHAINNMIYLVQTLFKCYIFKAGINGNNLGNLIKPNDEDVPVYTILVPLYKEEKKVQSLIKILSNLDYPKDKLDIMFLTEEDDRLTNRALMLSELPSFIKIIKIPYSFPRTKPKALNYVMKFVKGEYLTIYDAEDMPASDQLKIILASFNKLPKEYACIQCRLNFYNAKSSLLSRLFSIEYSVWFDYLLKGLEKLNLPITLGGTSNHIKVDILNKVGGWDSYNVTEDADLGLRLYANGYKVFISNALTLEEAPNRLGIWLKQRARWIKGFIQTLLVFNKMKNKLDKFTLTQIISIYIFLGFATYSFLVLPWQLINYIIKFPFWLYYLSIVNIILATIFKYTLAIISLKKDNSILRFSDNKVLLAYAIWPLYFLLHSVAGYIALWEMIREPFRWNKTPHGEDEEFII